MMKTLMMILAPPKVMMNCDILHNTMCYLIKCINLIMKNKAAMSSSDRGFGGELDHHHHLHSSQSLTSNKN